MNNNKKKTAFLFCALAIILACIPGSATTKNVSVSITTFVDESGEGILPETYQPLPNTLVIAKWNVHGSRYREVKLTDQKGQTNFSVGYTHFFDISVFPPCGYYSTTPLSQDVTNTEKTQFGFWPASPHEQLSRVKVLLWKDLNANGTRDPLEEVNGKVGIMFKIPGGMDGNVYSGDNFIQETENGWFDLNLGNSCGTIYVLWLNDTLTTNSVSAPAKVSNDEHGNVSIEIPYNPGETIIYWEMK
jgi:hypothetical protein